jgi:superoxide dismutase
VAGVTISPVSVDTGADADTIIGLDVSNLSGANANVTEYGIRIGTSYDTALRINNLNIFSGAGALSTSTSVVTGSYTGITGVGALDAGSITANFGSIDVGADSISTTGTGTFGTSVTSALFTNSTALSISTTGSNGAISFSPNGSGDVTLTADNDTQLSISGTITDTGEPVRIAVTLGNDAGADTVSGLTVVPTSVDTGADADVFQGIDIADLTGGNANVTERGLRIGTGYDAALVVGATTILNGSGVIQTAGVSGSYTGITGVGALDAGSITANFGSIDVGADSISTTGTGTFGTSVTSALFTNSTALSISTTGSNGAISFSPNGSGDVTLTVDNDTQMSLSGTITDSGEALRIAPTLGNDAGADTVSGITIVSTSVDTGADSDVFRGLDIADLTGQNANVSEQALRIGANWDNALVVGSTAIINGSGVVQSAGISGSYTGITGVRCS